MVGKKYPRNGCKIAKLKGYLFYFKMEYKKRRMDTEQRRQSKSWMAKFKQKTKVVNLSKKIELEQFLLLMQYKQQ